MADDPTNPAGPSSSAPSQPLTSDGTAQASSTDNSNMSLPDPFASDPFEDSTGSGGAQTSSTGNSSDSLPDPLAPSPDSSLPSAPSGPSFPQTGIWFNDQDSRFLLQWSLNTAQDPQFAAQADSQSSPPGTYRARVRIFQEVFETSLAAARPVVPFSLRDDIDPNPYLQGSLVLLQQPSAPPVLLVKNLRFPGFQQAQVALFPAAPGALGEESGG